MEPIKSTFEWERSTKRYHVYRDPTGQMMPDRIYVSQEHTGPNAPRQVTVTIEGWTP